MIGWLLQLSPAVQCLVSLDLSRYTQTNTNFTCHPGCWGTKEKEKREKHEIDEDDGSWLGLEWAGQSLLGRTRWVESVFLRFWGPSEAIFSNCSQLCSALFALCSSVPFDCLLSFSIFVRNSTSFCLHMFCWPHLPRKNLSFAIAFPTFSTSLEVACYPACNLPHSKSWLIENWFR